MSRFAVIVAAAGSGTRFQSGNQKKTYAILGGKPVWQHSVERFADREDVSQIVIVVSPEDESWFKQVYRELLILFKADVVAGGAERSDSVENALSMVRPECEFVAVHDAARPCASNSLIENAFSTARIHGNATPAVPVSSTLKRSADGKRVDQTVDRSELYQSQTPQVFRVDELRSAFRSRGKLQPTDEAQLFESLDMPVFLSVGCPMNRKITSQQDMDFAMTVLHVLDQTNRGPVRFDGPIGDSMTR